MTEYKFSVIVPVHYTITAAQLKASLDSVMLNQSMLPSEVVVVIDGTIDNYLSIFLRDYLSKSPISTMILNTGPVSKGPGVTRNFGVKHASYPIIAFMDSDDVSLPNRFEQQIPIIHNQNYDLVGGQIEELDELLKNRISLRTVPLNDEDIKKEFKKRNPINNVTVAIKKEAFLQVGGYPDLYFGEDYVLWVKMAEKKYRFLNLNTILVNVRTGDSFLNRRFGRDYFKKNIYLCMYLSKYPTVGFRYSFLRMVKFSLLFILPKRLQYLFVKKYTRNL
ncbi:glycosyltransferase [Sediminibacterium sp. KACHI17]|uniref:Glycosyltransferase n=1 Tax=Sediminibacterium sp. KACHI17 TaxID=1751071 RepID=A0AAT9GIE1_9BACT